MDTVRLCASIQDALRMVREACKVNPVLLRFQLLCMVADPAVVDLDGVIGSCCNRKFSRIVKVQRSDTRLQVVRPEALL